LQNALVVGLVACAGALRRNKTRRFLHGLSLDELEFIAGFVGSRILESAEASVGIEEYAASYSADLDLKVILLREYLSAAGMLPSVSTVRCRPEAAAEARAKVRRTSLRTD
jgi:hypothetical protein